QLSGGELQRIVITRAMTVEPSVIIFDEATSDLDVTTQRQILELLIGLKKKTNFAAIFVSHDIALVQKLADRIYVMLDGKVVESFKKENLRSDNRKEYTKLLTNAGFSIEETKISLINDDYVRSGVNVETKSKQKKR
ncbi:MAG: ATP-binding cassette domain-containing protein, partial [Clostridiales bacterium]|nr:ATP-binding cassette domain-containing protein [Clostridiales bacterium]